MTAEARARGRRRSPRRFYREALSEAERLSLADAMAVQGIDEEIALLRLLLRRAIEERPEDLALMFRGIELLARTLATRYRLGKDAENDLAGRIRAALEEVRDVFPEAEPHE